MDIKRYIRNDKLAELELQNLYDSSSEKERIEITKEFNKQGSEYCMPDQWAQLTIEKGSLQEKIAIARYAQFLDDKSEDNLKKDDNVLVRCAFLENENFLSFSEEQAESFKKLSQLERVAIMRNPRVDQDLVLKIYDFNDNDLN